MKNISIILLILFGFSATSHAEELIIRYAQTDCRYSYRNALLALALEKTVKNDGSFRLDPIKTNMTTDRCLLSLKTNTIDIISLPTSIELETDFLPIKVPILQGLLGARIFLIHKDNADLFSKIKSIEELRRLTAGFGSQWVDMDILKQNNLPTYGLVEYERIFKMLENKRLDYFPRGIYEAFEEVKSKAQIYPDLMVEKKLSLYYVFPVYYFVNKQNKPLAARVERGLKIGLQDGTFKNLFLKYHSDIIERSDLKNRLIFHLTNSLLPPNTAVPDTSWWLSK